MALSKCPRCELNYIREGEKLCMICQKEVKGGLSKDDAPEICIECGEREAVPGEDLCIVCMRGHQAASKTRMMGAKEDPEDSIDLADVSEMDEIGIDLGDDIPDSELDEIDEELDHDDYDDDPDDEDDE